MILPRNIRISYQIIPSKMFSLFLFKRSYYIILIKINAYPLFFSAGLCGETGMLIDGKCITNLQIPGNYQENINSCKRVNQSLAILNNTGKNYHCKMLVPNSKKSFFGLTNIQKDGFWRWGNGKLLNGFSDWKSSHPINSTSVNCAVATRDGWESENCNSNHLAICEKG